MVATEYKHIVKNPEIQGGMACFEGTRLPVAVVVGLHKKGATMEEILSTYPHQLTESKVYSALAYYLDNRDEIERNLKQLHGREE